MCVVIRIYIVCAVYSISVADFVRRDPIFSVRVLFVFWVYCT